MNKIKQYLHALENPTNSGFNSKTRKWGRGEYDPHQFQDGLDDRNTFVKNYLEKHKVDSIPEQDAIMLQDIYLKDLDRIWNSRTKNKNISDFKKTLAYGLMWHGYGPRLWNEGKSKESKRLYEAFQNGSDSEFSDAIYTFYKKYDKDRANRHKIYMNNQPLKENTTKLKFSKPSYIHVEYPDALRVDRLEPYTPIPRTPKPMHPIKENFWKAWSQMPYKQHGGKISKEIFLDIMKQVGRQNYKNWGFCTPEEATNYALKDKSYDYRSFYSENPEAINNSKTHWPDTYKGVTHRTFSNESRYHGKVDKKFNPKGLRGGLWTGDKFISQPWQIPSLVINAENK